MHFLSFYGKYIAQNEKVNVLVNMWLKTVFKPCFGPFVALCLPDLHVESRLLGKRRGYTDFRDDLLIARGPLPMKM